MSRRVPAPEVRTLHATALQQATGDAAEIALGLDALPHDTIAVFYGRLPFLER